MTKRNTKTNGIILRKTDYSEADRIFVILTKELGKISAIAKGVRKIKSKQGGHLEFFSNIKLDLYKSESTDLYRIQGSEAQTVHKNLLENLEFMEEGYQIIRLLNQFTEEKYPLPKIFHLSNDSFHFLNQSPHSKLVLLTFKIKFFSILGHLPRFDHCLQCHSKLSEGKNYFDFGSLGLECPACRSEISITKEIPFPMIKVINFIQKGNFEQIMQLGLQKEEMQFLYSLGERVVESIKERS